MLLSAIAMRLRAARACVLLVAVLVAAGAWLPAVARFVSPTAHACHCSARGGHASCACPICIPELREDGASTHATIRSTCGDEEHAVRPIGGRAVTNTERVVVALGAVERVGAPTTYDAPISRLRAPPPKPPPEALRSARS